MTVVECLPIGVLAHRCAMLRDTRAPCRANVRRGGACCLDIKRAKALIRRRRTSGRGRGKAFEVAADEYEVRGACHNICQPKGRRCTSR